MVAKRLKAIAALLAVLCISILILYQYLQSYWHEIVIDDSMRINVEVKVGESANTAVYRMHESGLTGSYLLSKLSLRVLFPSFVLKSGEYEFQGPLSRADFFKRLNEGVSKQYRVTLVEGKTFQQIVVELANNETLVAPRTSVVSELDWKPLLSAEAQSLMGDAVNPEGWFYPDTYYFSRGELSLIHI